MGDSISTVMPVRRAKIQACLSNLSITVSKYLKTSSQKKRKIISFHVALGQNWNLGQMLGGGGVIHCHKLSFCSKSSVALECTSLTKGFNKRLGGHVLGRVG